MTYLYRHLIFSFSLFFLFFLFSGSKCLAQTGDFEAKVSSIYTVNPDGATKVNQNYAITNLTSSVYPTNYEISLDTAAISHIEAHLADGTPIAYTLSDNPSAPALKLVFPQKNVGKGKVLLFNLSYTTQNLASKKGTALEVSIPKIDSESGLQTAQLDLMIPVEYGPPISVSPPPQSQTADPLYLRLTFNSSKLKDQGILALFGDKQVYDVNLVYHLENSAPTPVDTQLAFPPDTDYQRVFLKDVNPPPSKVEADPDGNWIATYSLKAKEAFPVNYHSQIIVYGQPQPLTLEKKSNLDRFLGEQPFWPVKHSQIQVLKKDLNSPQTVYQYVVSHLKYSYLRSEEKNPHRLGTLKALASPQDSLCLEYADTFVTLARAANIPAKLITGFGYSDNFQKKPTAPYGNVFHAWAAYFDPQSNIWREVDPTWGHTSGGNDYFSQIGFNHITFTINGLNSERPYSPGTYQQAGSSDMKIDLTDKFPDKSVKIVGEINPSLFFKLGLSGKLDFKLKNQGTVAVYNFPVDIAVSGRKLKSNQSPVVSSLLPYEEKVITLQFAPQVSLKPWVMTSLIYGNSQTHVQNSVLKPSYLAGFAAIAISLACLGIYTFFRLRRLLVSR